jgi:hypothetical protein
VSLPRNSRQKKIQLQGLAPGTRISSHCDYFLTATARSAVPRPRLALMSKS